MDTQRDRGRRSVVKPDQRTLAQEVIVVADTPVRHLMSVEIAPQPPAFVAAPLVAQAKPPQHSAVPQPITRDTVPDVVSTLGEGAFGYVFKVWTNGHLAARKVVRRHAPLYRPSDAIVREDWLLTLTEHLPHIVHKLVSDLTFPLCTKPVSCLVLRLS